MGLNVLFVLQIIDSITPKDDLTKEKEVDDNKKNLKDSIYFIHLWYEAYQKLNHFFAGLTLGIIFFTATFLLNTVISGRIDNLNLIDFSNIKIGMIFLGLSFIFYSMTIIFDYNWFIEGLSRVIESEVDLSFFADEPSNYRSGHIPMSIYGKLDLICSPIATGFLLIGLLFYGFGVWKILSLYLGW